MNPAPSLFTYNLILAGKKGSGVMSKQENREKVRGEKK